MFKMLISIFNWERKIICIPFSIFYEIYKKQNNKKQQQKLKKMQNKNNTSKQQQRTLNKTSKTKNNSTIKSKPHNKNHK